MPQAWRLLDAEAARLADQALDAHGPGLGLHALRVARRIGLVGAELVEVVVAGDIGVGVKRLQRDRAGDGRAAGLQRRQLARPGNANGLWRAGPGRPLARQAGRRQRQRTAGSGHLAQQRTALAPDLGRRDVAGERGGVGISSSDQHGGLRWLADLGQRRSS